MVLLLLVVLANHGTFLVEQPRQSLLYRHVRWDWFVNKVAVAPLLLFYMGFIVNYCSLPESSQLLLLEAALRSMLNPFGCFYMDLLRASPPWFGVP